MFRVGNLITVREETLALDGTIMRRNMEFKIVGNYPKFIVCERPAINSKGETIRTSFLKHDLIFGNIMG